MVREGLAALVAILRLIYEVWCLHFDVVLRTRVKATVTASTAYKAELITNIELYSADQD
jgi:hypothetical protein